MAERHRLHSSNGVCAGVTCLRDALPVVVIAEGGWTTGSWTFLSHHAQVFLCVARDPDVRLREIATDVGITERSVQTILNDLVADGYVDRSRVGRRNHYAVNGRAPLRHRMRGDVDAAALLRLIA